MRAFAALLAALALGGCGGSGWTRVESGTERTLHAVWAGGPDDAWAVGEDGTVLRWNGGAWRAIDAGPGGGPFTAVVGIAPGEACVVDDDRREVALVAEAGGGRRPVGAVADLVLGLWAEGPRDVWVAHGGGDPLASSAARPPGAAHFRRGEDGSFRRVAGAPAPAFLRTSPPLGIFRLFVLSAGEVFCLDTHGQPHRFDGIAWRPLPPLHPDHSDSYQGLGVAGAGAVLAVGGYGLDYYGRKQGFIARFDGTAWTLIEHRLEDLNAVAGAGPDEAWAVGHGGVMYRFRGK